MDIKGKASLFVLMSSMALYAAEDKNIDSFKYDLTTIGQVKFSGSIDRLPISIAALFKNDLKINHVPTPGFYDFADVEDDVAAIIDNPDKSAGRVALFFEVPAIKKKVFADYVPKDSFIKIAYNLVESSSVPERWVEVLNERFDLVITADEYYRSVYQDAGVTIPVFVQPHGIYIEDFLEKKVRTSPSHPFVFGCTSAFWPRKNQELLIEAFHEEFGHDQNVKLVIHGRPKGGKPEFDRMKARVEELVAKNIELLRTHLTDQEYKDFFCSLDCYVLISKGEGLSLTPREALALGRPSIISNNTAHKTICEADVVCAVPSDIAEAVPRCGFGHRGNQFNCDIRDVRKALREVYENYETYVQKAQKGREWVKQYCWPNVKQRFMNFIKPTQVLLGDKNIVTDDYLMTNSPELYDKYIELVQNTIEKID